jgi:hypothetical protein
MRKKRRIQQTTPDETVVHPVGREQFVHIQRYVGDIPCDEPIDWFEQADEYEPSFLIGNRDFDEPNNQ